MVNTRSVSRATGGVSATAEPPTKTAPAPSKPTRATARWSHTPDTFTVVWLAVSLPLVCWDTVYVLGRPHTMEGGALHWPLWAPYKLYGEIDHVYGWKAFNAGNGFTAAQGLLNAVETAMYLWYFWLTVGGRAKTAGDERVAAKALLVGFSAAVMTLSKTALYCESRRIFFWGERCWGWEGWLGEQG